MQQARGGRDIGLKARSPMQPMTLLPPEVLFPWQNADMIIKRYVSHFLLLPSKPRYRLTGM